MRTEWSATSAAARLNSSMCTARARGAALPGRLAVSRWPTSRQNRSRRRKNSSRKPSASLPLLSDCEGRNFYAVGGTWRALARLHMWQTGYPLHVMHGYAIAADDALEFARLVHRVDAETLSNIEVVASARRPLLSYAALVLEYIVRIGKPRQVIFSALGVREGLLYSLLKQKAKEKDALIEAARGLNKLRSRSPRHGEELIAWTDRFMASSGLSETAEERRLRHAACLLADIGWRAHPDYRGEQSLNIIAHGGFTAIDHPGRAYLALAGILSPRRTSDGRRVVAAAARTRFDAHPRPRARARRGAAARLCGIGGHAGRVAEDAARGRAPSPGASASSQFAALGGERVLSRLRALSRLIGRDPVMLMG